MPKIRAENKKPQLLQRQEAPKEPIKALSKETITPEIAAFVVKEYLLPIFESDGKKLLKNKKREQPSEEQDFSSLISQSNTVFSELKLSGILLDGMNAVKQQIKLKEQQFQDQAQRMEYVEKQNREYA